MSVDRMAEGYEPRFDLDAEVGRQGVLLCNDIAEGIASGSVEVKTDARSLSTGRVYVEYACRRSDGWALSGISTTSSEVWAFALGSPPTVLVALPVPALKEIARRMFKEGNRTECRRGSHPTRGVLIPLNALLLYALDVAA